MSHVVSCYHLNTSSVSVSMFCTKVHWNLFSCWDYYMCVVSQSPSSLHGFKFVLKFLQICQHASYKFSFTKYVCGYGKWTFALVFCVHFQTHIDSHIMSMGLHCAELLIFLHIYTIQWCWLWSSMILSICLFHRFYKSLTHIKLQLAFWERNRRKFSCIKL